MIVNGNVEIDEQETGTYVFPVREEGRPYTWALFIFKNGGAHLFTKRDGKTGALLGDPIELPKNAPAIN